MSSCPGCSTWTAHSKGRYVHQQQTIVYIDFSYVVFLQVNFIFTVKADWNTVKKNPAAGLPSLNGSQCKAVDTALNNNFTLIWGPPGKTW